MKSIHFLTVLIDLYNLAIQSFDISFEIQFLNIEKLTTIVLRVAQFKQPFIEVLSVFQFLIPFFKSLVTSNVHGANRYGQYWPRVWNKPYRRMLFLSGLWLPDIDPDCTIALCSVGIRLHADIKIESKSLKQQHFQIDSFDNWALLLFFWFGKAL